MFLQKKGFPQEEELVLCTVTNIQYHSVFVQIDEYQKTGLVHISEIAAGRIRNIRDFVQEQKKIVCKVLRVDKKTGHIDLSLRRVNEIQKRNKIDEIKQEQKAEKIIEMLAKEEKQEPLKLYTELSDKVFKKYDDLTQCFSECVKNDKILENLGIDKKYSDKLIPIIQVRFKEEEVVISGMLTIKSYEEKGLELIKKALQAAENSDKKIKILYEGGGKYRIEAKSENYKSAEQILAKAIKKAMAITDKGNNTAEFKRKEKKE